MGINLEWLNKSERVSYKWIKENFPNHTIVFNRRKSPDFVLSNGTAFEVKRAYPDKSGGKHILQSSSSQFEDILAIYPDSYILVVSDDEVQKVSLKDLVDKKVENIIIYTPKQARKNVTIRSDQDDWIQRNHINLSGAVQDMIDKMMKRVKYI